MHQLLRANDVATQRRTNALVTQADAQNRQLAHEVANRRYRNAGLVGGAGAGRHHQAVGLARGDFFQRDFVVAEDFDLGTQLAKVLDDVVGEAVVVIDHQQLDLVHGAHSNPSSTSSLARSKARALASVSFHSSSGTESATTPAAACTYRVWFLMMPVRMAIATSMSPA